ALPRLLIAAYRTALAHAAPSTLPLHDALPISGGPGAPSGPGGPAGPGGPWGPGGPGGGGFQLLMSLLVHAVRRRAVGACPGGSIMGRGSRPGRSAATEQRVLPVVRARPRSSASPDAPPDGLGTRRRTRRAP